MNRRSFLYGTAALAAARPSPAAPARLNMRRVLTSIPAAALRVTTAVSTARNATIAWPMKSG